jgi:hypothetical protein
MTLPPAKSGQSPAPSDDPNVKGKKSPFDAGSATIHEINTAIRETLERALAAEPRLSGNDWRVLSAVIHFTARWSKLDDEVGCAVIAQQAGLRTQNPAGDASKHLRKLRERNVIVYAGGQSIPPRFARIGLRPPAVREHELLRVPLS